MPSPYALVALIMIVDNPDSMDNTWNVEKKGEDNIDNDFCATAHYQKDGQGWEKEGNDDLVKVNKNQS